MWLRQSDFDTSDHFLGEATNNRQIGIFEQEMKISRQARYADAALRTVCKYHVNDRYRLHITALLNRGLRNNVQLACAFLNLILIPATIFSEKQRIIRKSASSSRNWKFHIKLGMQTPRYGRFANATSTIVIGVTSQQFWMVSHLIGPTRMWCRTGFVNETSSKKFEL